MWFELKPLNFLIQGLSILFFNSKWVSLLQVVPEKGGLIVVKNENELILTKIE